MCVPLFSPHASQSLDHIANHGAWPLAVIFYARQNRLKSHSGIQGMMRGSNQPCYECNMHRTDHTTYMQTHLSFEALRIVVEADVMIFP